jgi:peptidyl-tRNA hydrolase, PTH1 family
MHYIVGLGNPGEKYKNTRHNIGWLLLDACIDALGLPAPHQSSKASGRISEGVVVGTEVICLYPDTFMNHTGKAVAKLVPPTETLRLIVLYDDIDLPLGEVKVSFGRGDGGHNGIKSIVESLHTKDFIRVRIGIASATVWPWETGAVRRPKGDALAKYVLGTLTKKETAVVAEMAKWLPDLVTTIIRDGKEVAMQEYN